MPDPLSLAGLSIAIFDQLLKLGERTAQLISDARSFNDDTDHYHKKILDEINRTKQLRHILFEPSPIYGGNTLFENFDEDVQGQIKSFLGRLVHTLREASDLIENRYGMSEASSRCPTPPATSYLSSPVESNQLERSPSPRSPWRTIPRQLLSITRWSLQDKKRTEEIIKEFSELNGRIHEHIKLWCLASSIGLNIQHLRRLQDDENSIQLGFDVDATLQITASECNTTDLSFELADQDWLDAMRNATPLEDLGNSFSLVEHDGKAFLQESRTYERIPQSLGAPPSSAEIDQRTERRINNLARLLHQPKEKIFCIPHCIGWKYLPGRNSIPFVFEIPAGCLPKPMSLHRILEEKPNLTMGHRYKLALALANCIKQLHMVKWFHESFRSENILFFPSAEQRVGGESEPEAHITDFTAPCVLGFEFARPEIDFSSGFEDIHPERDVYRHPERQGRPDKVFNKLHDIYSLGVVLLEIGLWQQAITLQKDHFVNAGSPFAIQAQLLKHAKKRLAEKVGEVYQQIVIACLTGNFGVKDDTREDLKLQLAFRTQVVDPLEKIASVV